MDRTDAIAWVLSVTVLAAFGRLCWQRLNVRPVLRYIRL